jgi:hypothetical protein
MEYPSKRVAVHLEQSGRTAFVVTALLHCLTHYCQPEQVFDMFQSQPIRERHSRYAFQGQKY